MTAPYKMSFVSIIALVFLLPIFFIPASLFPIALAKMILISVLSILAFIGFLYDVFRKGSISLPSTRVLWAVPVLPAVYLASALFSKSPQLSLFGYTFEINTFAFILIGFVLLFLCSVVLTNTSRILKLYSAFFISLTLLIIFACVKLSPWGNYLTLNNFSGNMGNPVGSWTDYAAIFGLFALLSVFALEMLKTRGLVKLFLYLLFILSVLLLIVINYSVVWMVMLITSLLALVYFMTIEKNADAGEKPKRGRANLWPAGTLFVISLLFAFNPMISSRGTIGDTISAAVGISNADVRPSFMTTMYVSGAALKQSPILGSGPNTFDQDWLLHKPQAINSTNFWNTNFTSGFGFLPSQVSTTGIVGTLAWIMFLLALLLLAGKSLSKHPEDGVDRFFIASSCAASIFLWILAISYVLSAVILLLAFIFTGVFVASVRVGGVIPSRELVLSKNSLVNFVSLLVIIMLAIGTVAMGFVSFQKSLSVYHLQKALVLSNKTGTAITAVEGELAKAIRFSPADIYYTVLSELQLSQAKVIFATASKEPEKSLLAFQESLAKAVGASQQATRENERSYQNWVNLGSLYGSLVPRPLAVAQSYESAIAAYKTAQQLNPQTPEIPLFLAQLELDKGNVENARKQINAALVLKPDYVDAYFFLAQLEASENNIPKAIEAARAGSVLSPNNAGIFFELGLLQYTNKQYSDAITSFTKALTIAPDYANAKYFLGLSLEALGRRSEALAHFRDLVKTNPDNKEIREVLNNLEAGRAPVATPLKSSTPPVKNTSRTR